MFEKVKKDRSLLYKLIAAGCAAAVLAIIYFTFKTYPVDYIDGDLVVAVAFPQPLIQHLAIGIEGRRGHVSVVLPVLEDHLAALAGGAVGDGIGLPRHQFCFHLGPVPQLPRCLKGGGLSREAQGDGRRKGGPFRHAGKEFVLLLGGQLAVLPFSRRPLVGEDRPPGHRLIAARGLIVVVAQVHEPLLDAHHQLALAAQGHRLSFLFLRQD